MKRSKALTRRGNLGGTRLAKRRAGRDSMAEYDALPSELRSWIAEAAMPWSPRSCLKIWRRAKAEGASRDEIIARLTAVERVLLAKDAPSFAESL